MGKQKGRKRKGGDPAALFWMAVALGSARMPMLQQYAAVVLDSGAYANTGYAIKSERA